VEAEQVDKRQRLVLGFYVVNFGRHQCSPDVRKQSSATVNNDTSDTTPEINLSSKREILVTPVVELRTLLIEG
jgi:hypothetical protein